MNQYKFQISRFMQLEFEHKSLDPKSISFCHTIYYLGIHSLTMSDKIIGSCCPIILYIFNSTLLCKGEGKERAMRDRVLRHQKEMILCQAFCRERRQRNITFYLYLTQPLPFSDANHVGRVKSKHNQSVKHHKAKAMFSFQSSVKAGQHHFLSSGTLNSRKETLGI